MPFLILCCYSKSINRRNLKHYIVIKSIIFYDQSNFQKSVNNFKVSIVILNFKFLFKKYDLQKNFKM